MMRQKCKPLILLCFMSLFFAFQAWAAPQDWPEVIRFGIVPSLGEGAETYYTPLISYLTKQLGIEVKPMISKDYEGIISGMVYKQIDFAYFGPKSYVEAGERCSLEALVLELNKEGEAGYYGLIISRKGSDTDSFEKAKGRTFAFTDPNSTSGYLVPSVMFARDLAIDPKTYFKKVIFSGSHKDSVLGVKNGTIEVAATNTLDLYRMEKNGEVSRNDFNILQKSELIPGSPICARTELPQSLKDAFQKAMIEFGAEDTSVLEKMQFGGYIKTDDKIYSIIRDLNRFKKELGK